MIFACPGYYYVDFESAGSMSPQRLNPRTNFGKFKIGTSLTMTSNTLDVAASTAATNLDLGASGTAGSLDIFPGTASKGKLSFVAANNTNNSVLKITNVAQDTAGTGIRTFSFPNTGADAVFALSTAALSLAEMDVLDGATAGTAVASKALVADANIDVTALRNVTATGTVTAATFASSAGNGAIVADKCTAVETGDGVIHKTTLTFTLTGDNDLDLADGADHGTGVKVYDFPEGRVLILGATCNAVVTATNAAGGGGTFPMGLGTASAGDEATLTGTEQDIIPSTAITGGETQDFHAALAASAHFDGTTTAKAIYVNAAILDATSSDAVTVAVTGTATITWINLGDY
jgi:hypothetical protein